MTDVTDPMVKDGDEMTVVTECDLPHSPEKVWRALTVPELLATWLMPNDMTPSEGERFTFREAGGAKERIDCEVLEAEPFRRLRYSWQDREARNNALTSTVTFELSGTDAGGTRLRITHSGKEAVRDAKQTMAVSAANTNHVPRLLCAA